MEKFRFLNWQVYIDSKKLFKLTLTLVKKLPKEFRFELGSQLIRSAMSISLNIAEGSGKTSDKELNRFLDIALGSLYETIANLDILKDSGLISEEDFRTTFQCLFDISNQIGGFKRKIRKL